MNDHCGPEITLNFITFGFPKINYVLIVINYGYVYYYVEIATIILIVASF